MFKLPQTWIDYLATQPETGMGYHQVDVTLHDGQRFERLIIAEGHVVTDHVWFFGTEIKDITLT
jgi:hypothetical protein